MWWHNGTQQLHVDEMGQSLDEQGERLGDNPLDPRGDGTLREGDPLFDMLMGDNAGTGVHARRRKDGTWDVTKFNDHEDGSD